MYYSFFILYLIIGFSITLGFLFWAIKNGQFKDQQRAKFLPLVDVDDTGVVTASRNNRYQSYLLYCLMAFVLMVSVSVMIYAFMI